MSDLCNIEKMVDAVCGMRYDQIAQFVGLVDQKLQHLAKSNRRTRRVETAMRLDRAANHLGLAKNELDRAWEKFIK